MIGTGFPVSLYEQSLLAAQSGYLKESMCWILPHHSLLADCYSTVTGKRRKGMRPLKNRAKRLVVLALMVTVQINGIAALGQSSKQVRLPGRGIEVERPASTGQSVPNSIKSGAFPAPASTPVESAQINRARVNEVYGNLPLSFEANQGQVDNQARFLAHGGGFSLFLTSTEAVFAFSRSSTVRASKKPLIPNKVMEGQSARIPLTAVRMKLVGASPAPQIEGLDPLAGRNNYFIGNDPKKWRADIPNYTRVKYHDVYPGVNLIYHGRRGQLEYDLEVLPGADPRVIQLCFQGIKAMRLRADGDLGMRVTGGEICQHKPVIYQEAKGVRQAIAGSYVIKGKNRVGFKLAKYDTSRPLVIDPTLVYSTYLGGSDRDIGQGIAVDSLGNAYITGETHSPDFPATPGAFSTTFSGSFVTKLNPTGTALVYSTFLGHGSAINIAADSLGNAYVTGLAFPGFPTTGNAFQPSGSSVGCAFVTVLNAAGSGLVYSTFLGTDHETGNGIAVDSASNAYVTGVAGANFPTTANAFQPSYAGLNDAFLVKLNPSASGAASLVYSTYLGGTDSSACCRGEGSDVGLAVAVDTAGNAYITGATQSANFPTTPGAFQTTFFGSTCFVNFPVGCKLSNAFVAKVNPSASGVASLVYSTFLAGPGAQSVGPSVGQGIAVDNLGNAYVTGVSNIPNFPTTPFAFQTRAINGSQAFVTKLNPTGTALVYSTFLARGSANGIAVDSHGNATVVGATDSVDFPVTPDALQATNHRGGSNGSDAFVTRLKPDGSDLIYSTYFGGNGDDYGNAIALDSVGDIYVTGSTTSTDLLRSASAFQGTFNGAIDVFMAKLSFQAASVLAVSGIMPDSGGDTGSVTAIIQGAGFLNGVAAKLARNGQTDIVGDPLAVGPEGKTITATFDLRGKTRGLWDVVVTSPSGVSVTLHGAFAIEEGRAPQVWVDIIGRQAMRGGRRETYFIQYGNRGNIDANLVRIWITFPTFMTFFSENTPSSSGRLGDSTFLAFDVPVIPPGLTGTIPVNLIAPNTPDFAHRMFEIQVWTNGP
jgi:hypothetical protein